MSFESDPYGRNKPACSGSGSDQTSNCGPERHLPMFRVAHHACRVRGTLTA